MAGRPPAGGGPGGLAEDEDDDQEAFVGEGGEFEEVADLDDQGAAEFLDEDEDGEAYGEGGSRGVAMEARAWGRVLFSSPFFFMAFPADALLRPPPSLPSS